MSVVAEEGKNRLKMQASGPESSESLAVWAKLLEQDEEHSTKDIHDALLLGLCDSCACRCSGFRQWM